MNNPFEVIDHDTWLHGLPKLRAAAKINFGTIEGVLPFEGKRNPTAVSSTSYKAAFQYKTAANKWKPRLGLAESGAELAVAEEILVSSNLWDLEFQPVTIPYTDPNGVRRNHTIDLRQTFLSGRQRLIFVRNRSSLEKPFVQAEIECIRFAARREFGHQLIVVDGDSYTKARRDNLRRMHRLIAFQPDQIADDLVEEAVARLTTLWRMSDLTRVMDLEPSRVFQSCLRLIARKKLGADMNGVISHNSRIWRVQ